MNRRNGGVEKSLNKPIRQSDGTFLTPFQQAKRYIVELPVDMHTAVLRIFAEMLYAAGKVFKRAIDAIIDLATHTYKSFFDDSQAADIRSVMRQYGKTEEEKMAVGDWMCDYADSLETIERADSRKARTEVMEIAEGRYDQTIDRGRGSGMSR